jgi:SAM-dependent methyltransferase
MNPTTGYVPALAFDWATRLYDVILGTTLPEKRIRDALIRQAEIREGHDVLDLGCGTGTLTRRIAAGVPGSRVRGIDGDAKILKIAREKARRSGSRPKFDEGLAQQLPYGDGSFDRVVSCLLFHHLSDENKRKALEECLRVLRPGGRLHVADWGWARNPVMRTAFFTVQILDGFQNTRSSVRGGLPEFIRAAGFCRVEETGHFNTVFGTLSLYRAMKCSSACERRRPGAG